MAALYKFKYFTNRCKTGYGKLKAAELKIDPLDGDKKIPVFIK